mgnify:CR=1 FL=1
MRSRLICKLHPLTDRVSNVQRLNELMMGLIETTSICKTHQFLQHTPSDPSATTSKDLGELKAAVDRDIEVIQLDMKKIETGLNDAVKNKMKYAALKEREVKALLLKQSLEEEERIEEWVSSDFL